jgi:hypothetical protein
LDQPLRAINRLRDSPTVMHFLSIDAHGHGRADAQSNPVALNGGHDDPDLLVNDDHFTDAPAEH